jgi:hypothetical protein
MTNLSRTIITMKYFFQQHTDFPRIEMNNNHLSTDSTILPFMMRFGAIAMSAAMLMSSAYASPLELRRDAREPSFAQVMYAYYQNKPYDALTTMLANRQLAFNSAGTGNILLSDLYTRYGLPREADAALTQQRRNGKYA